MSDFVISPPSVTAIPVVGGGEFPVRRVYCVGRNYAAHAREMGADPNREPPFYFSKPRDAITCDAAIPYPSATADLHHEVELVLALKSGAADVPTQTALDHVFGAAVGVDLTRRDIQADAKASGRPWDMAKGFDQSAPVGAIQANAETDNGRIELAVNGETRQSGDLADMIWSAAEIVSHLSKLVRLEVGDVIFTGTPAGVGPLRLGDQIDAQIEHLPPLSFTISGAA